MRQHGRIVLSILKPHRQVLGESGEAHLDSLVNLESRGILYTCSIYVLSIVLVKVVIQARHPQPTQRQEKLFQLLQIILVVFKRVELVVLSFSKSFHNSVQDGFSNRPPMEDP
jgi:hypothetical protein